ncbi:hypothetical protein BCR42DRAFT_73677 [Absidia repens]|uniref:Uncharacterized protein n=1 Tax=Absidia repens TaxID=90262 RepID=A0A1X2IBE7_9FUNG|nr:hypothetical protein BCR42DRAFT_73677 [Absidia repens]
MSVMPLSTCATQTLHEKLDCGEITSTVITAQQHNHHFPTHDPMSALCRLEQQQRYASAVNDTPVKTKHYQELSDLTCGTSDDASSSTLLGNESVSYQNTLTTSPNKQDHYRPDNILSTDYFGSTSISPMTVSPSTSTATQIIPILDDRLPSANLQTIQKSINVTNKTLHPPAHYALIETGDDDYCRRSPTASNTDTNNSTIFCLSSQRSSSMIPNTRVNAAAHADYTHSSPANTSTTSTATGSVSKIDLGHLDDEEEAVLEAEIAARRAARRSRRRKHYADTDDEEDHVRIGTRIAEGHRNYQLMQVG